MPWKVDPVSQRAELVALMREGTASVSELCRRYGVSRKTAYKWLQRYESGGVEALRDRSRAPHERPLKTPIEVEEALVAARRARPLWGARKLAAWLAVKQPGLVLPSVSTCHDILVRHGLVESRPRRRQDTSGRQRDVLTEPTAPNHVWSVDFKGQFRLGDRSMCFPLTLQDAHTRLLLRCDALTNTRRTGVRRAFELAFRRYGLPRVIRSDNGAPFAAPSGGLGWSVLTVWFQRLGIEHELMRPASPQQNGRHERMHRTLKKHTARPPRCTLAAQQRCFDAFRKEFNEERPHEALGMATPSSAYQRSDRRLPSELPEIVYPGHLEIRIISRHGELRWNRRTYYVSEAFTGERLGLEEMDEGLWDLRFGTKWLGYIWEAHPELGLIRPGSRAHEQLLPMCPNDL